MRHLSKVYVIETPMKHDVPMREEYKSSAFHNWKDFTLAT